MGSKIRAIALLSGGLDSQVAACLVREQGINVTGVVFTSPLFDSAAAVASGNKLGLPVEQVDFTVPLVEIFERYATLDQSGEQLCLDVHAEMIRRAVQLMEEWEHQFICTGDVLNQRGPTQSVEAIDYIRHFIEMGDCVLRPLSARLLPQTLAEREGWVDRDRLLDVEGNDRSIQQARGKAFGVEEYADPARTNRLTEPRFGDRLRDLRAHEGLKGRRALGLLRLGRHFRLGPVTKLVVGRTPEEDSELEGNVELYELVLRLEDRPGPIGLLPINATEDQIRQAAAICVRYSEADPDGAVTVRIRSARESRTIEVSAADAVEIDLLRV